MDATKLINPFILLVLMTSYAICAPVADIAKDDAQISGNAANKNANQDEDLKELMNLVHQQANKPNVMVHQQEMSHFENKNGQTVEVKQEEEKVLDTKTGDVLADVKQEVKQESLPDGPEPETVVKTEVDIPAEGVHETVVQNTQDDFSVPSNEGIMEELSPVDVAEFLYSTQQFDLFYSALNKLVNQSKLSPEEAEEYASIVALEYERLQLEEPILSSMLDNPVVAQRSLQEPYENNFAPESPIEYGVPEWEAPYSGVYMTPEEKYLALLQQQQQQQQLQQQQLQQQQQMQEEYAEGDEINPYDFLSALWEEAYGKGNVEAQAIVQMLYDRVSTDSDSDDMGQIRDILVDSLASSFDQPQEIPVEFSNAQDASEEEMVESQKAETVKEKQTEVEDGEKKKEEVQTEAKEKESLEKQAEVKTKN